ncbi:MAG: GNAT family N-acetyltransferase [Candidatus Latescibacteria bacterium]|nr:GNAT family N-acetyltransferase [Candidatus Latescibacterota bacterium]
MSIHHWSLDRAGDLAECYNRQIAPLPYCYPQLSERFAQGVQEDLAELYGESRKLHSEEMIVAADGNRITGFVHVGVLEEEEGEVAKKGVIRFMGYEPGQRSVGQALLEEAEQQFHTWGTTVISAFAKGNIYHFCSPDGGHSELAGHITSLLGMNGYETGGKTVNMVREEINISEPIPPEPEVQITVEGDINRSILPGVMVHAEASTGDSLGMCLAYPLEYVQAAEGAQDQLYINWLSVRREFQGKGWGAYLLLRTLWEAQKVGYQHSILGTGEENHKAQLFYANYGYRTTHSSYSYYKDLRQ